MRIPDGTPSENVNIYNVTMTLANTEYSQVIPNSTKKVIVSVIDGTDGYNYRLAFVTGKVATPTAPYLKYYTHNEKIFDNMQFIGTTLYFACSTAGRILQIEAYI